MMIAFFVELIGLQILFLSKELIILHSNITFNFLIPRMIIGILV